MKKWFGYLILTGGLCVQWTWAVTITSRQITYQGTLKQQGVPVGSQGTVFKNMAFRFVDAQGNSIPGTPTSPIPVSNVPVTTGLFSLTLPLDPAVNWQAYSPFIEISVEGQKLTPNQPINANVYSMVANTVVDGAITYAKLDSSVQTAVVPPGAIMAYGGSAAPAGWLLCDGSAVSRSTYSGLFSALGVAWGGGDGVTTFNLPDLRGRTPVGAGQGPGLSNRPLATTLGAETHTLTPSELPVNGYVVTDPGHVHAITDPGHSHFYQTNAVTASLTNGGGGGLPSGPGNSTNGIVSSSNGTGITINSAQTGVTVSVPSGGNAYSNMQPSAVTSFIIKY